MINLELMKFFLSSSHIINEKNGVIRGRKLHEAAAASREAEKDRTVIEDNDYLR